MFFEVLKKNFKKLLALSLLFAAFNLLSILVFLLFAQDVFSIFSQVLTIIFLICHIFVRTSVAKSIHMIYTGTTTTFNELLLYTAKVIGAYALFFLSAAILFALYMFFPLFIPLFALLLALSFLTMVIGYYRIIAGEPFFKSFIPKGFDLFTLVYFFFSELIYNGIGLFILVGIGGAANSLGTVVMSFLTTFKIVSDYYILLGR
ncbi:MAG: hypothetical protein QW035_03370 [Candidatus Anstonellales archaeon]